MSLIWTTENIFKKKKRHCENRKKTRSLKFVGLTIYPNQWAQSASQRSHLSPFLLYGCKKTLDQKWLREWIVHFSISSIIIRSRGHEFTIEIMDKCCLLFLLGSCLANFLIQVRTTCPGIGTTPFGLVLLSSINNQYIPHRHDNKATW